MAKKAPPKKATKNAAPSSLKRALPIAKKPVPPKVATPETPRKKSLAAKPLEPPPRAALAPAPLPPPSVKIPAEPDDTSKIVQALSVSAQASAGAAANGNHQPANILVVVTHAGWPVTELGLDHFTLMEHFEVPGQTAPFSNNIVSFRNVGTGAYLLQTRPINGAPWRTGHHLGQLLVSTGDDQQGQAAFKLIIR